MSPRLGPLYLSACFLSRQFISQLPASSNAGRYLISSYILLRLQLSSFTFNGLYYAYRAVISTSKSKTFTRLKAWMMAGITTCLYRFMKLQTELHNRTKVRYGEGQSSGRQQPEPIEGSENGEIKERDEAPFQIEGIFTGFGTCFITDLVFRSERKSQKEVNHF